ncbi:MAG: ROK family protein [Nitrososphaeria archaeon]
MPAKYLAIDLGATNLRVGLWDGQRIIHRETTSMIGVDKNKVFNFLKDYASSTNFESVGLASAGPLDLKRGTIRPINWIDREINIVNELEKKLDSHVYLQNDCVASVLAELVFGAGRNVDNLVYITMSTGIGAGVVIDGHVLLGKDGNAHEIGHLVINYDDDMQCGCGGKSHWEAYCGGANMPKFFKKYTGLNAVDAADIFKMARNGNLAARDFVTLCAKISAAGIGSVINAYDPDIVTIGGSVFLNNSDLMLNELVKQVKYYTINRIPEIIPTPLGHDAPLIGAGILASNNGTLGRIPIQNL